MSKTPTGRPVAPGVDPITPAPTPAPDATPAPNESFTSAKASEATKLTTPPPPAGNGATAELEMVTVKTKGAYILMDPFTAKSIDEKGDEVPMTSFIADELAEGGRLEKA